MNYVAVTRLTSLSAFACICLALTVFVLAWVVPPALPLAREQVSVGAVTLNFVPAWNLAGNGSSGTINVAAALGDSANVTSVCKWFPSRNIWAF